MLPELIALFVVSLNCKLFRGLFKKKFVGLGDDLEALDEVDDDVGAYNAACENVLHHFKILLQITLKFLCDWILRPKILSNGVNVKHFDTALKVRPNSFKHK